MMNKTHIAAGITICATGIAAIYCFTKANNTPRIKRRSWQEARNSNTGFYVFLLGISTVLLASCLADKEESDDGPLLRNFDYGERSRLPLRRR